MRTWLIELSPTECAMHLASERLGRVGVIVDGRPEIFPVHHVYDEPSGHVVFTANADTKLGAARHWPWVAFEVDGLTGDDEGWSVLVVGRIEELADADELARSAASRVGAWATGDGVRWLRIVPDTVTGRRFARVA